MSQNDSIQYLYLFLSSNPQPRLAPIQTTCVLSKFALSPEQMEKSDIIFKASFNEFSSSARDNVESSAYWLIRNSELLILIPLIFGLNSCFRDVNQTKITDQSARRIFNEIRRCHLCPTNKPSCVFVRT